MAKLRVNVLRAKDLKRLGHIFDFATLPVRLEGRHIRRGLPGDCECVASYGLRPSFVHPRPLKRLILVLSRGTQRAGAPPFKRLPALPQGPSLRSGL